MWATIIAKVQAVPFSWRISLLGLVGIAVLVLAAWRVRAMAQPWRIIFLWDLFVIAVLVAVAVWFVDGTIFPALIPDRYRLPVHCAWFGGLGGVVISLKGIYDHASRTAPDPWNDRFNLWHVGRPISGAITGLVTFVLLLAINPNASPAPPVVYAAAFVLGTQERRFFNFLYEVGRLILQVPNEPASATLGITDVQPPQGHANDVLVVRGSGFAHGFTVKLDGNALANLVVSSDGTAAAGVVPPHHRGPVTIAVVGPGGHGVVRDGGFTYL